MRSESRLNRCLAQQKPNIADTLYHSLKERDTHLALDTRTQANPLSDILVDNTIPQRKTYWHAA